MGGSVLSRPDHYEVLGLAATAGEGEIARAFARKMSLFGTHAPGEAAQICAAYETLRNPEKRRAYDRSLGIGAKPEQPRQWTFAMTNASWPGFVGTTAANPSRTATSSKVPEPEPLVTAQPDERGSPPELERAAAIAASLRRLADPAPVETPVTPKLEPRAESWPVPKPDPVAGVDIYRILDRDAEPGSSRDEGLPFEWRRPALLVGGFIVAAGLVGAFAGFSVKDSAASAAAPPEVTVPLPAAKQVAAAKAPVAAPVEMTAPAAAPARTPEASRSRFARAVESKVGDAAAQAHGIDLASAEVTPEAAAAQPIAASLPLPEKVIARTIERIGYSCGKVTGAVAGGSPGVYQVTCSSGDTYQARPVNGRYRFRRSR